MEKEIDIAKILKNALIGTKLYSPLFGNVYLTYIGEMFITVRHHNTTANFHHNGRLYDYEGTEPMLYPSKEMRDWRKFFKKGDVLVSKDRNVHIIFEKFEDDAYKNFHGQYYLWEEGGSMVSFEEDENYMQTSDFNKANKEDAQEYIHKIEKELGGKLNMETLEFEKPQPEFKDGDIVVAEEDNYYDKVIFIAAIKDDIVSKALINVRYEDYEVLYNEYRFGHNRSLRLATEEEKQQLFDALARSGKTWDAEKKEVVDLKPKVELKPFDKVLCRNSKDDTWEADFFARLTRKEIDYTQSGKYLCVGDLWMYCIPYNEETAHLLGTTDDWEEGEV